MISPFLEIDATVLALAKIRFSANRETLILNFVPLRQLSVTKRLGSRPGLFYRIIASPSMAYRLSHGMIPWLDRD